MKTVLVTGATGFIGRHTLAPLLAEGYEVHAVSSREHARSTRITWHRCDLLDPNKVEQLISCVRPTHLLHFAWYTTPGKYQESIENLHWSEASLSLARAFMTSGGKRAVFAGTCFEYDYALENCREDFATLLPRTFYGWSKKVLREAVVSFAEQASTSVAWGHIFHLYGPYEPRTRLVPSVILSLLDGERARCSEGRQVRDFLHVEDVAIAFVSILNSAVEGRVNIGSGRAVSIRFIVDCVAELLDASDRVDAGALPTHPDDPPYLLPDLVRLHNEVGWHPRWSLEDGLAATIRWWQRESS